MHDDARIFVVCVYMNEETTTTIITLLSYLLHSLTYYFFSFYLSISRIFFFSFFPPSSNDRTDTFRSIGKILWLIDWFSIIIIIIIIIQIHNTFAAWFYCFVVSHTHTHTHTHKYIVWFLIRSFVGFLFFARIFRRSKPPTTPAYREITHSKYYHIYIYIPHNIILIIIYRERERS